eukprot:TRINITY_DN1300_c1_g2_i1.p1 TRINITY_DN1300_c1_g2~~TRINITY_DN1300_c1_g2_i1.p1  ORF type:complete len:631 (+),score=156.53 TRINITY_DN1300_c1_g2_i1:110-1894(+)
MPLPRKHADPAADAADARRQAGSGAAAGRRSPGPLQPAGSAGRAKEGSPSGSPHSPPGGVHLGSESSSPGGSPVRSSPSALRKAGSPRRGAPPSLDTSQAGLTPAETRQAGERVQFAQVASVGVDDSAEGRFALTIDEADEASKPLSPLPPSTSPASSARRVKHFQTEEEQDGYVLGTLKTSHIPVGSPSHKVTAALGLSTPALNKRRMSSVRPPTTELCPLFPGRKPRLGTEEWVPRLNRLLQGEPAPEVLPFAEFHDVMIAGSVAVAQDPGCPVIPIADNLPPLAIVGDLHGQLTNLLRNVLGPVLRGEMAICRWLFLGDLVDRGPDGCEVLAMIAIMKLCYPDQVWVLRGNHEDAPISYVYGFYQECENKYGTTPDGNAWQSANTLFLELPIAAVVKDTGTGKKFFCCHGGLTKRLLSSPDCVELINSAQRVKYGQMRMNEVIPGEGPDSPMHAPEQTQELLEGLMWSDPDDGDVYFRASARGAGEHWGKEASRRFCETHRFEFICRAHQMVQPGYHRQHKGLVLTVFSAADYCGMGNKGAVLRVEKDKVKGWKHRIAQYDAPPPDQTPQQAAMPLLPYFRQGSDSSLGGR